MSGGSYDYMFLWGPEKFLENPDAINRIVKRLLELKHYSAARSMHDFHLTILQQTERIRRELSELQGIMKAVEWCDSGDSDENNVAKVVKEWEGKRRL